MGNEIVIPKALYPPTENTDPSPKDATEKQLLRQKLSEFMLKIYKALPIPTRYEWP